MYGCRRLAEYNQSAEVRGMDTQGCQRNIGGTHQPGIAHEALAPSAVTILRDININERPLCVTHGGLSTITIEQ